MQAVCYANTPIELRDAIVTELDQRIEANVAEQATRRSKNDKAIVQSRINELKQLRDFLATLLVQPKPAADKPAKAA